MSSGDFGCSQESTEISAERYPSVLKDFQQRCSAVYQHHREDLRRAIDMRSQALAASLSAAEIQKHPEIKQFHTALKQLEIVFEKGTRVPPFEEITTEDLLAAAQTGKSSRQRASPDSANTGKGITLGEASVDPEYRNLSGESTSRCTADLSVHRD